MTAEIAILNREAIALASDSAVTVTQENSQKIFTSANKLFALSKYWPIGIMVYGKASLLNVPWETIIKVYRNQLETQSFDTLKAQAEHFIDFLDNGNNLVSDLAQKNYFKGTVFSYFTFIKNSILERIEEELNENGPISTRCEVDIINDVIKKHYDCWNKKKNIPSIPKEFNKEIIKAYNEIIEQLIEEVFEKLPLYSLQIMRLKKIVGCLFSKFSENVHYDGVSGIVIAGFGKKDIFPALVAYNIEGMVNNKLKYYEYTSREINDNLIASVVPFAQSDMVATFMRGVDLDYSVTEKSYLSEMFDNYIDLLLDIIPEHIDEKHFKSTRKRLKEEMINIGADILDEHNKKLNKLIQKKYVNPIIDVVSILPKDELAAMAESLINLTSFKRKVSMESETVGGPIDVAVISKNDGFIWIKRKHYFKPELNPQFFENYYRVIENE